MPRLLQMFLCLCIIIAKEDMRYFFSEITLIYVEHSIFLEEN